MHNFLKEFVINPMETGTLMPSGPKLCRLLSWTAGVRGADTILQFGTGTGVVTKEILRHKSETARLIGIEINNKFASLTRKRYPQVDIINESVAQAKEILAKRGLDGCDCIVSTLPWSAFPETLQDELLDATVEVLRPGGSFVTYVYLSSLPFRAAKRLKAKLNKRFDSVGKTSIVWSNFPPALVYVAMNK